jgi:hypothetical protein
MSAPGSQGLTETVPSQSKVPIAPSTPPPGPEPLPDPAINRAIGGAEPDREPAAVATGADAVAIGVPVAVATVGGVELGSGELGIGELDAVGARVADDMTGLPQRRTRTASAANTIGRTLT